MSKVKTTSYASWRGKIVEGDDPDFDWFDEMDGTVNLEMPFADRDWQYLGVAPRPVTRWDWFWFDYHHGRLMRYPWISVVRFSTARLLEWNGPTAKWRREILDERRSKV